MCLLSCIDGSALDPSMGMGLLEGKTTPITSFCDTSTKSFSSSDSSMQNILARVCTGCSVMVLMLLGFTTQVSVVTFRDQTATVMDSVDPGVVT